MLRVLIIALVLTAGGLMVWQQDFAGEPTATRYEPPVADNPYPGVPPWIAERSPAAARAVHQVQVLFRGPREETEKPGIRRGVRSQPDNWDTRYTKRVRDLD